MRDFYQAPLPLLIFLVDDPEDYDRNRKPKKDGAKGSKVKKNAKWNAAFDQRRKDLGRVSRFRYDFHVCISHRASEDLQTKFQGVRLQELVFRLKLASLSL